MKAFARIFLCSLFFCFLPRWVAAQPAQVYLDSAVRAIGGQEALLALQSLRVVSHGENFEPEQTVQPGDKPRKVSTFTCTLLRDLQTGNVRYEWDRKTVYPLDLTWRYTEILNGDEGAIIGKDGIRSPDQRPASAIRIAARRKELSRAAVSLLINALSRSGSLLRLLDQMIQGKLHYIVSFSDHDQPVILAIDAQTRLPTKVDFLEDDPIYGDTHNELFFADWREVGGVKLPFSLTYYVNGRMIMTEQIDTIELDVSVKASDFAIPEALAEIDPDDGRRGESGSHWVLRRIALASPLDDEQTHVLLNEVHNGVWQITGGTHHSMVVEMRDYLIVVEAPLYEARSQAVLTALGQRFPGKPVRYVINTHFHNDHAGGLRGYVAAGATVVTGKVNDEFLRRMFAAPHTLIPDQLQQQPKPAVIETIDQEKRVLTDGKREVEVYPVDNAHAAGMLIAYLPQEKLLFVSDLFTPGSPRQLPTCRELLTAIGQYKLQVTGIVGGHGNKVASFDELRQAAAVAKQ